MRTVATLVAASAALSSAFASVGTYPCGVDDGAGNLVADQSMCTSRSGLPYGGECVLYERTGEYFCGFVGARCTRGGYECDNGFCDPFTNTCAGDFGDFCTASFTSSPRPCLGNLECSFSLNVAGGYCGTTGAACDRECVYEDGAGITCTGGVYDELCDGSLECRPDTLECGVIPPSPRARRERRKFDTLCPSGLGACAVDEVGKGGYECLDFDSSLENCGGCVNAGVGQDCSMIDGAVGIECIAGQCIATSCEPGFTLDSGGACTLA